MTKRLCAYLVATIGKHYPELLLNYLTKFRPDLFQKEVAERGTEFGLQVTMLILDKEGIAHCKYCPSRFGLRKNGVGYICESHFKRLV